MKNLEKQKELAKEAVGLIKEFRKESEIICDNTIETIKIKKGGSIIEINDMYEGEKAYNLEEISSIFSDEMKGWGPCSAMFYEGLSEAQSSLESEFGQISKAEFKKKAGNLKYMECRCEAIFKRLQKIEIEAGEV